MLLIGTLAAGLLWFAVVVIVCGVCASAAEGDRSMLHLAGLSARG